MSALSLLASLPAGPGRSALVVAFLLVGACSVSGRSVGGDAGRGLTVATAHCTACHGADGNSTNHAYPRLAGQQAVYLYDQLRAFRDGSRPSGVMAASLTGLSDADMRDIAAYYAGQTHGSDLPGPATWMAQGRRLFFYGSGDGRVPACAACHDSGTGPMGPMGHGMGMSHGSMMGMMRAVPTPDLFGQHASYVLSQLDAFARGVRPARSMGRIARAMSDRQARAVADYVAAHP